MEIEPDVEEFLENSPTVELLRVSGGDPGEQSHSEAASGEWRRSWRTTPRWSCCCWAIRFSTFDTCGVTESVTLDYCERWCCRVGAFVVSGVAAAGGRDDRELAGR